MCACDSAALLFLCMDAGPPKPAQDRWGGGEDAPMQRSGRPCWEAEEEDEEEVEIGMWSNSSPSSQEASAPGNWPYSKKIPPKVTALSEAARLLATEEHGLANPIQGLSGAD